MFGLTDYFICLLLLFLFGFFCLFFLCLGFGFLVCSFVFLVFFKFNLEGFFVCLFI